MWRPEGSDSWFGVLALAEGSYFRMRTVVDNMREDVCANGHHTTEAA
jgi:hypothetical protein